MKDHYRAMEGTLRGQLPLTASAGNRRKRRRWGIESLVVIVTILAEAAVIGSRALVLTLGAVSVLLGPSAGCGRMSGDTERVTASSRGLSLPAAGQTILLD